MSVVRAIVELEETRDFARRVYEAAMQSVDSQGEYIGILIGYFKEGEPTEKDIALLTEANRIYGWCGNAAVALGTRAQQLEMQMTVCRNNNRSYRRRLERENAKLCEKAEILLKTIGLAHEGLRELGEIVLKMGQEAYCRAVAEHQAELEELQGPLGKNKNRTETYRW